jgi:hypothetical protein
MLLGALALTALVFWAGRGPRATVGNPSAPSRDQPRVVVQKAGRDLSAVSTVFEQKTSAYHARLFADEDGVVLVTQTGFAWLPNGEAAEEHTVALDPVAVRQGGSLIFWRSGSLRQISLSGENDRPLVALARAPQYLLASENRLAWIDFDRKTSASLQTLSGGEVRVVAESEDRVCASVLRDAVVYWVVQAEDGTWKIGSIGLDGQHRVLTGAHQGRPPAMLALGQDGVYFYDGPERGLRRVTFELDREDAVLAHVICSPLVVSNRAVCAHVGGLFDVPPFARVPRLLASERDGPITALAATDDRVFWVAEGGENRLVVRTVPLPGL